MHNYRAIGALLLLTACAAPTESSDSTSATTAAPTTEQASEPADTATSETDTTNASTATPGCLANVGAAESVDEMQDTGSDYYPAYEQCTGLADFVAAVQELNGLDGVDPVVFAYNGCSSPDAPSDSVTCQEALAADPYGG